MTQVPMWRRWARMFGADPARDVEDELQFHLLMKVDDLVEQGWPRDEARKEAERLFGDLRSVRAMGEQMGQEMQRSKERRDYWGEFAQDLRYAFRTLRKERGFAIISVLILALGIAANTAVFSVVNAVLLRPLPFPESQNLAWLRADRGMDEQGKATAGLSAVTYTVAAFEEYQRNNRSFQSVTGFNPFYGSSEYTMTGRGEPRPVVAVMVAENFFPLLGVKPMLGRHFVHEECVKGGRLAVLVSESMWRNQFGANPGLIGQTITLSKQAYTVVGILPASFDFGAVFAPGQRMELFIPAPMAVIRNWGNTLSMFGRLKPGVSVARAQAEADVLFPQLRESHKDWYSDYASTVTGLKEYVSGKLKRSLVMLWCAVGLILLIVCVNLSNLQMARAAARSKEFAVRSALGAGRARLCRQLLTESLVLAGAGGLLGLGLAYGLTFYFAHQDSIALPLLSSVTLDWVAVAWTMGIALSAALVFGLVPGLRLYSGNVQEALRSSGQGMTTGRRHERMRSTMVVSEMALACVLLIGSGLLLRSFLKVLDVDLGFQPSRAAVIKIDFDDGGKIERRGPIVQEILRNVKEIPGIESAGIVDMLPLGRNRSWGLTAKGVQYPKGTEIGAIVRIVTPGYLGVMGMRLRSGRDFTWSDGPKSDPVVIINEAASRYYWRGEDPMSRPALINGRDAKVIGVIADVRENSLEDAADPEMYLTTTQADPEGAELVIRTSQRLESLAPAILKTLRSLNPGQPAAELRPLQHIVDRAASPRRFFVMLVTSFALLGLVLASLGIYGVISYSVTRQTQEIGIRMALGASGGQVQAKVIGNALRLAVSGAALGAIGSFVIARSIATLLYGTEPSDPLTFVGVIIMLCGVALAAGYIPARRASRIHPMTALREG